MIRRRPGVDKHPLRVTLGPYNPHVEPGGPGSLAWARKEARAALEAIVDGKHPDEERRLKAEEERLKAAKLQQETFGNAVAEFIAGELGGLRSGRATEATLRRVFLGQQREGKKIAEWIDGPDPVWRDRPVAQLRRLDIVERLDAVKRGGGKHAARHALSAVRKFFNWAAEGERWGVEVSPCAGISDRVIGFRRDRRELKRTRVLSDDELRHLWAAAEGLANPYGSLVKLLAITGQRLNDIASARWSEIDLEKAVLTVPPERYKTATAHEVPLTPRAVRIIEQLPRFAGGRYALTTTAGRRPISGTSKMKQRLDLAIAAQNGGEPVPAWTLHDIRRTVRTRLTGDCEVEAYIAERVIGHALPGLHSVYDQGTHRPQKRDALERWERALLEIVEPKPPADETAEPPKVVPMRGRR